MNATAEFYVDSPRVNTWQEPEIEVGGWIWGGVDDPVVRVVLESGAWSHRWTLVLSGMMSLPYLGEPGATLSGFHSRLELPVSMGSDQSLQLVAYRQSGERIEMKAIRYRPVKNVDFVAALA